MINQLRKWWQNLDVLGFAEWVVEWGLVIIFCMILFVVIVGGRSAWVLWELWFVLGVLGLLIYWQRS